MSVSGNYPAPVLVNGYQCWNCTDVDEAKKHIDPAHPKSGPFNIDAKSDPTRAFEPSVKLGGVLAGATPSGSGSASTGPSSASSPTGTSSSPTSTSGSGSATQTSGVGGQLDISV